MNYPIAKDELCLPFIKLKDLSERDLIKRRQHIRSRIADEERIKAEKELKRERTLKEKEENVFYLSPDNYIWEKQTIKLPSIYRNNTTKPYLTLFDRSSYQYPVLDSKFKKKDLLLRFNTSSTIKEVERDFHPIHDCGVYRRELEDQIRRNMKSKEKDRKCDRKLDELMIVEYPFGRKDDNRSDNFRYAKFKIELGDLDETFFPWCTSFGKASRTKISKNHTEPIICKTKSNCYIKM